MSNEIKRESGSSDHREKALEARARRAAKRAGYKACKSVKWRGSIDNFGGFQIIDLDSNVVVAGRRFDMSPEEVMEWCKGPSYAE